MKFPTLSIGLTFALAAFANAAALPLAKTAPVRGDYVEARTASVFAGACHYNGERVTEGRSAVMAWNIAAGVWTGVDLSGVKVVAAVACDDNLAEAAAARTCDFVVDAPNDAVAKAAVAWVRSRCGDKLGSVTGVRLGKVTFRHDADTFAVAAAGFAAMSVRPMPDGACCSQPHLVWYEPLMGVDHRRVGFTVSAEYDAGRAGDAWQRSAENSAFYGTFGG